MGSLIPGYEYDIFISYRQKDNKGDRWVSEFVDALKTELESTFKEDISVYFDINPHDGLLETHDVDASLKDKLKCLVFIPIVSRTYCDTKSFAWEHEFKAFIEQVSKDQFGLKVKLHSGNIASRVLPIQIHDLYPEDKTTIEKELGGVLRAIEFIYKEPGVNKPLTAKDNEDKNLNKTNYKIQINKVANAIDEIINGIRIINVVSADRNLQPDPKVPIVKEGGEIVTPERETVSGKNIKRLGVPGLLLILCIAGVFGIFKVIEITRQANDIANLEKSIAVLPFINDSPDKENEYFCNGMMDEILNNLQRIKDFRVLSRTSTEQYRGASKPTIPQIAKALDVNYIVEGSVQKYGNIFRLRVQLIATNNEKHLWGESFEQEIQETKDIFKIQSRIAQTIAKELKATITPEENQLIEKISTTNLTAYDFYQRGEDELDKYLSDNRNHEALMRAEQLYKKSLTYDSKFSLAYVGLARIYYNKQFYNEYFSGNFLDSFRIFTDIALSLDDQLAEAYYFKARYYLELGEIDLAEKEYNKSIKYNPNYWQAYNTLANRIYFYSYNNKDFVKGLEYMHKAISLNHGKELPGLLRSLAGGYHWFAGYPKEAIGYIKEAFMLDGDSIRYFRTIATVERGIRNYEQSIELHEKCYKSDTTNLTDLAWLAYDYYMLDQITESMKYTKKYENRIKEQPWLYYSSMKRIGYVYWESSYKEEALKWFDKQKQVSEGAIKKGRWYSIDAYYDLAAVYAFLGDKKNAYKNLKEVAQVNICELWRLSAIKDEPLFDGIRNEPEFQEILKEMESKYQAEHERVEKWLEEQGQL